jgi:hypothetical protein
MKRNFSMRRDGSTSDGDGTHESLPSHCPICRNPLAIHQPDPKLPNRLLGTCSHCLTWLLIDIDENGQSLRTPLPRPPGLDPV